VGVEVARDLRAVGKPRNLTPWPGTS